ncbi:MAG: hypothetical protein H7178_00470 [Chitinophagaceae bacterium]|nr:hypothetical protein [Chitinophagaceae bacterium]
MKKALAGLSLLLFVGFTSLIAQPPGGMDPAAMKERMKERMKPQLVEKTKISDAQADKVIDIYFDAQMETRKLRQDQSLSQEDKDKKNKEINDARDKKIKEIPLNDEQVKSVAAFYEEQRKRMQERGGGRPAGN